MWTTEKQREANRRWRAANRDAINAKARADRIANPEKYREYNRIYYRRNREMILASRYEKYHSTADKRQLYKQRRDEWVEANRERVREVRRAWYAKHRDEILAKQKKYYWENREEILRRKGAERLRRKNEDRKQQRIKK